MLVLTRKSQQQIQIGDNITISILKIKGNAVSVGIDAPRSVRVVRSELPLKDQPLPASPNAAQASEPTPLEHRGTSDPATGRPVGPPRADKSIRSFLEQRQPNSERLPENPALAIR